ncbi:TfoX/Sxy family protein, partial [Endothiovibrio diazotrophicus]
MGVSVEYLEYLSELLEWLPRLRVKRMFGGAGFYSEELFFAIADDDGLYLKGDGGCSPFYEEGGGERFAYV